MLIDTTQARLTLPPGQVARFELARCTRLRGVRGTSWITLDNDRRDIVLGPGEEFVADGPARAIACALRGDDPTELLVTA